MSVSMLTALLAAALAAPAFGAVPPDPFRRYLDGSNVEVAGLRRALVEVPLDGRRPSELTVHLVYSNSREAVQRLATDPSMGSTVSRARAECRDGQDAGWALCSAVFPFPGNPRPNRNDDRPLEVRSGQPVYYRWHRTTGAATEPAYGVLRELTMPRRFMIVNMGDSYASGEGAPSASGPKWEDEACHRSRENGKRRAVEAMIAAHRDIEFRFLDVSCSGATIEDGILGRQEAIYKPRKNPIPAAQIEQVTAAAGADGIDIALLNIGGNDIGFADIVMECMGGRCDQPERRVSLARAFADLIGPNGAYGEVADALVAGNVRNVFISEVPDLTHDETGAFCDARKMRTADALLATMTANDVRFAFDRVLVPFNAAIRSAAQDFGWHVIDGMMEATRTHGICESVAGQPGDDDVRRCNRRYFSTVSCSIANQGLTDYHGAFHPTVTGHLLAISNRTVIVVDSWLNGYIMAAYERAAADRDPVRLTNGNAAHLKAFRDRLSRRSTTRRRPQTAQEKNERKRQRRANLEAHRKAWGL